MILPHDNFCIYTNLGVSFIQTFGEKCYFNKPEGGGVIK